MHRAGCARRCQLRSSCGLVVVRRVIGHGQGVSSALADEGIMLLWFNGSWVAIDFNPRSLPTLSDTTRSNVAQGSLVLALLACTECSVYCRCCCGRDRADIGRYPRSF